MSSDRFHCTINLLSVWFFGKLIIHESSKGPLRIGILRARKEEAALLSVPEGKALIQVRGFRYEDDGSLRENHRVILRPDRIRLLL